MKQFYLFLTAGMLNTLLGYSAIFACMYLAKMSPEISNAVGYAVGLVASYLSIENTFSKVNRNDAVKLFDSERSLLLLIRPISQCSYF
jgi:putative flippase GtrA